MVSKNFMLQRVMSRFFVEIFLSHSAENFRRGTLYCCINFGYRKSLEKRGWGASRFFIENFLSHSAENLRRDSFTVALVPGTEKVWIRGGGEYKDFPSKFFGLTVPKISVGESFNVAFFPLAKKFG